ncbi:MAG TPA: hypothetical protein VEB21_06405 [Terriglobales bacterium]|nr:hypothetical protein [Terriglobales bacterium]
MSSYQLGARALVCAALVCLIGYLVPAVALIIYAPAMVIAWLTLGLWVSEHATLVPFEVRIGMLTFGIWTIIFGVALRLANMRRPASRNGLSS